MDTKMNWVDEQQKKIDESKNDGYFNIVEGDNRIQLLTHAAPLPLHWTGKSYEPASEGEQNVSIKGVCWVLHDSKIKQAKLPYTVVKAVRELMEDPDYAFDSFPMPRLINIKAKNAGTKEVEYTVIPAPKETDVSKEVLDELAKKATPEEIIEKIKGNTVAQNNPVDYPEEEIDPSQIPF